MHFERDGNGEIEKVYNYLFMVGRNVIHCEMVKKSFKNGNTLFSQKIELLLIEYLLQLNVVTKVLSKLYNSWFYLIIIETEIELFVIQPISFDRMIFRNWQSQVYLRFNNSLDIFPTSA